MEHRRLDDPWLLESEDRFAARAKELRAERGISQQEMARRLSSAGLKMHQSSVAKMERDDDQRRPIRLVEALVIARILGSTVDEMLAGPHGDLEARIRQLEAEKAEAERQHEANMAATMKTLSELTALVDAHFGRQGHPSPWEVSDGERHETD